MQVAKRSGDLLDQKRRARTAANAARAQAHIVHHYETALWGAPPRGSFMTIDEPKTHVPVEARAELIRRYLAAFGPS